MEPAEIQLSCRRIQVAAYIETPAQTPRRPIAFILRQQVDGFAQLVQPFQRVAGRQLLAGAAGFTASDAARGVGYPRLQRAIAEIRNPHADGPGEEQRRRSGCQDAADHLAVTGLAADSQSGLVAEN